ncbi:hypothetical protein [Rahnella aceris]|uniref:hypothetical protein n=1 Tax=Rahnella sp. (strain Y9602) TaxID=2703885 RepID=UPI003654AFDD
MIDTDELTLWPESNYYLKLGLAASPLSMHVDMKKEYIFIDFSMMHIRYLTNSHWIALLKNTNKKLILICDSVMGPLAEYWRVQERRIYSVIYSSCELNGIVETLKLSHSCSCLTCKGEVKRLSAYEVHYMDLTFLGLTPLSISKTLNIPIKKVYNTKRSINNKFRKDIKLLCLNSCGPV